MKSPISLTKLIAGLLLAALSTSSMAVDLSTNRTNPNVYSDGITRYLPLDNAGNTFKWVFLSNLSTRAILYNAECAVKANDNNTWYNIDIEILSPNGVATKVSPTDNDNALCTSKGNNALANWSSNASQGTYKPVQAGWHRIRVSGNLVGYSAGDQVRIDDISLIVTD